MQVEMDSAAPVKNHGRKSSVAVRLLGVSATRFTDKKNPTSVGFFDYGGERGI
jgi:hypothetical protein